MNSSPTTPHKFVHTGSLIAVLLMGVIGGCTARNEDALTLRASAVSTPERAPARFTHANNESPIDLFAIQPLQENAILPQRLVGRTITTRDTDVTLDALETIVLKPENGLIEPLSASAQIFGFQGAFSPCDTPNGDPPISRYQAIVQSGGPGTNGVGPADERTFEIDLFGTIATRDNNVTIMGIGHSTRKQSDRIRSTTTGTITSLWTNSIAPGTTIPDLPAGATDVRIDAAIIMAGFNELDDAHTKTLCIQFIDNNGDPMSRTNQVLDQPATTRQLTVDSELGYIILVTFTTTEGPRYLQWSGNIQLNNLAQPVGDPIADYAPTNPLRDNGRELAYDMQRRASMMIIRYADKNIED